MGRSASLAVPLSDGHNRVFLSKPLSYQCVWTRQSIEDQRALALSTQSDLGTHRRLSLCSLGSVVDMEETLRSFTPSAIGRTDEVELSPSGDVRYHVLTARQRRSCAVCDKYIGPQSEPAITFYQQKYQGVGSHTTVRIHPDCCKQFIGMIEDMWNHADVALGAEL